MDGVLHKFAIYIKGVNSQLFFIKLLKHRHTLDKLQIENRVQMPEHITKLNEFLLGHAHDKYQSGSLALIYIGKDFHKY